MNDVPEFIHKAEDIYGYHHFINDAGGSVCELDSADIFINTGTKRALIVHQNATGPGTNHHQR